MNKKILLAVVLLLFVAAVGSAGHKHEAKKTGKAAEAFEKLKALAGEWNGTAMEKDGPPASESITVTAGGNAVMEKQFAGTEHEMITMYHLDGEDLIATHYCAGGNQPKMKLNQTASNDKELVFEFVSATGLDSAEEEHISGAKITLVGASEIETVWNSRKGSSAGQPMRLYLRRASR